MHIPRWHHEAKGYIYASIYIPFCLIYFLSKKIVPSFFFFHDLVACMHACMHVVACGGMIVDGGRLAWVSSFLYILLEFDNSLK